MASIKVAMTSAGSIRKQALQLTRSRPGPFEVMRQRERLPETLREKEQRQNAQTDGDAQKQEAQSQ